MTVSGTQNSLLGPMPSDPVAKLKFAAEHLEALWMQQVLKEIRPGPGGFFGNSLASKMFKEMMDEAIAKQMAKSGTLGFAKQMVEAWKPVISSESVVKAEANAAMNLGSDKHE